MAKFTIQTRRFSLSSCIARACRRFWTLDDLPAAQNDELLARDILAHALLLFTRGIPVIYNGDEQGFTGKGGDAAARQDMLNRLWRTAKGTADYKFLGTADSPPYRIFPTRDVIPSAPELEFKAIARDLFNRESIAAQFEWKRRTPKRPAE